MTKDSPVVTVVTAALNNAATISGCIESVASQDYGNIEHLVIDGGSTDGTREILEQHGVSFTSERDTGIYDAFNKGIAGASGEFIQFLNADDYFKHEAVVSRMLEFMLSQRLDLGHGKVEQIDRTGKTVKTVGQDVTRSRLLRKCRVAHPSVFTKRSVFEEFGNFNTAFRIAGDHEFLLRIWGRVATGFLPEVTTVMRLGGVSNSNIRLSYRESMAAAMLHGSSPVAARANYYYEICKSVALQGLRKVKNLPGSSA